MKRRGRPIGHAPANRGKALVGNKLMPRTASPVIRQLIDEIDRTGLSGREIERDAGVSRVTISRWRHGRGSPRITDFEAVARYLGYRLKLESAED